MQHRKAVCSRRYITPPLSLGAQLARQAETNSDGCAQQVWNKSCSIWQTRDSDLLCASVELVMQYMANKGF
jgi:hypothetical protein